MRVRSGLSEPRRGHAVRGAPASQARGTTRRRGATAFAGARWQRGGSLHKNGAKAGKGRGPRDCYRGFIGSPWLTPAAGGKGAVSGGITHGRLAGEGARRGGGLVQVGRGRAGCAAASVSSYGRRRGEAPGRWRPSPPPRSSPPPPPPPLVRRWRKG
jgi:hypothetical protein